MIGIIKSNQSPLEQGDIDVLEQLHNIIKSLITIEQKQIKLNRDVKEGTTASEFIQQSTSFNISDASSSADIREDFGNLKLQGELGDIKKSCVDIFRHFKLNESLIMGLNK